MTDQFKAWADVQVGEWITDKNGRPWRVIEIDDRTGGGLLRDSTDTLVRIPPPQRPVQMHRNRTAEEAIASVFGAFPDGRILRDSQ